MPSLSSWKHCSFCDACGSTSSRCSVRTSSAAAAAPRLPTAAAGLSPPRVTATQRRARRAEESDSSDDGAAEGGEDREGGEGREGREGAEGREASVGSAACRKRSKGAASASSTAVGRRRNLCRAHSWQRSRKAKVTGLRTSGVSTIRQRQTRVRNQLMCSCRDVR